MGSCSVALLVPQQCCGLSHLFIQCFRLLLEVHLYMYEMLVVVRCPESLGWITLCCLFVLPFHFEEKSQIPKHHFSF